ncbi:MAG: dTMP kinase [Leptospiraceae bacterium]|nr:dTMP kinase [Leptospiraceae bacterium]
MTAIKKEETASGLFVVLEGIDGSGKTTAWSHLKQHFAGDSDYIFLREPTDLPTGQRIRACLQGEQTPPATDAGWKELFVQDRRANVEQNIVPGLQAGKTIIQDRYKHSTAAYQGADAADAHRILDELKEFPEPDILIYLRLSASAALKRIDARSARRDHFESQQRLERIAENYGSILPRDCIQVDAEASPEAIQDSLLEILKAATEKQGYSGS